jgi:arylsulfatase A-like enzyme
MVEHMDKTIGQLLSKLDSLGLRERTLVVFSSDNGGHTHSRNLPLRGEKATLWEGGIRVPCIARWPGVLAPNSTVQQVAITMDWTATFRCLAGLAADSEGEDGIDLMPLLTEQEDVPRERTLFWRRVNRRRLLGEDQSEGRAVRHGNWKLIELASGERFLFDLATDISETENLIDRQPSLARQLHDKLDAWEKTVGPARR